MKRMAWSLVVAGLVASQVQANDPAGDVKPTVDPVPIELEVTTLEANVDSAPLEVQTGVVDDPSLMTATGVVDGHPEAALEMQTMMLGGEHPGNVHGSEELMMNAAAFGLPGLGDNRINFNAFGLFGEHRDSMRLAREGQSVTSRKVGLLHLFSRNKKAEVTVRTVSTTERARAQKMAEIDRLRDQALKTGDRAKLAEADKLEAQLNAAPAKAPSKRNPFRK